MGAARSKEGRHVALLTSVYYSRTMKFWSFSTSRSPSYEALMHYSSITTLHDLYLISYSFLHLKQYCFPIGSVT